MVKGRVYWGGDVFVRDWWRGSGPSSTTHEVLGTRTEPIPNKWVHLNQVQTQKKESD